MLTMRLQSGNSAARHTTRRIAPR